MIWVGKLGSVSVAGVGVAGTAIELVTGAMMGLTMGMRALIARFIGAGNIDSANHVAKQALVLTIGYAILLALVGTFFAESILNLFGLAPDVVAAGVAYMRIQLIGAVAMVCRMTAEGVMQASGDTMTPMRIAIVYRLFHVTLCPFLVFGLWLFPRLEIQGAATTNIVSQTLGLSLSFWVLLSGRSRIRLTLRNFHIDPGMIWRIVRIGLPAMVGGIQRTLSNFFLMLFMAPFGTIAVAAHSINLRVEMILFMPGMAFGMASGVLAGQNLGARQPDRAEKGIWMAVGLVQSLMVVLSVVMLVWAEGVISIFNSEPSTVAMGSNFLRIAVVGYFLMGLMFVLMQSLTSTGDTMPMMIMSIGTAWAVTLPLAYFLPRMADLGPLGVRWAMVAGIVVGAVATVIYFRLGRWKTRRV
jgi:putative MATE family efflux protein